MAGPSRRFILTAKLNVIANQTSVRRARAQIETILRGSVARINMVAGRVAGQQGGRGIGGAGGAGGAVVATRAITQQQGLARATMKTDRVTRDLNHSLQRQTRYMSTSIRDVATLTGGYLSLHLAIMAAYKGMSGAVKFEAQLADMAQILGTNVKNMSKFGDQISELSMKFGIATDVLAKNSQELLQAGKSISEVKQALPILALLGTNAQVGSEGLQVAAKAMIVWSNTFEMSMNETRQAFEKTIKLSKMQYVNVAQLIDSTTILASLNEGLNISFEETIGLVAALRSQTGRPLGEVSRGLRTIETRITRRPKTIEFLEERGVEIFDKGQVRNIIEVISDIADLQTKLGRTSREAQQLQQILGGIRRSEFGAALLRALPQVRANIRAISGNVDEMDRDFQIWSQTTQYEVNKVAASFKNMFREVTTEGDSFQGLARGVLTATKSVLDLVAALGDILPILAVIGGAALFKKFGVGSKILGGGMSGATAPVGRPYGGFYTPGYTKKTPFFFPHRERRLQDKSRFWGPRRTQTGWDTAYKTQHQRGSFTPREGMQNMSQRTGITAGSIGMGSMIAGGLLTQSEKPTTKGIGAGLTAGGITSLMAGPALGVLIGSVAGLKTFVDAYRDQIAKAADVPLSSVLNELSNRMLEFGKSISVAEAKIMMVDFQKGLGKYGTELDKAKSKVSKNPWDWMKNFDPVSNKTAAIPELIGEAIQKTIDESMKNVKGKIDQNFLLPVLANFTDMFNELAKSGVSSEFLSKISKEMMDYVALHSYVNDEIREFYDSWGKTKREAEATEGIISTFNDALSNGIASMMAVMKIKTSTLKNITRPLKDISQPETLLPSTTGLESPMYSQRFRSTVASSGIERILPGTTETSSQIDQVLRSLEANITLAVQQSGTSGIDIAAYFKSTGKGIFKGISNEIKAIFLEALSKLDFQEIEDLIKTGGWDAVKQRMIELSPALKDFGSGVKDAGDALKAWHQQMLGNVKQYFDKLADIRQARLGIAKGVGDVISQQRQWAGLPTQTGIGTGILQGVAGGTVQSLIKELDSLYTAFDNTSDKFEQSKISLTIGDVKDKLRMLADATARTADYMQRLGEVEKSRTSKLGVLEEFFSGGMEQRQQMQKETRAAQMAVRRGSLLRMPNIESQQMAVSGLQRFSGVENFMGTKQTGGQLLEKLLERAGGKWMLPENTEKQNLQRQVLQEQRNTLLAQAALVDREIIAADKFFIQLTKMHAEFYTKFLGLMPGLTSGVGIQSAPRVPGFTGVPGGGVGVGAPRGGVPGGMVGVGAPRNVLPTPGQIGFSAFSVPQERPPIERPAISSRSLGPSGGMFGIPQGIFGPLAGNKRLGDSGRIPKPIKSMTFMTPEERYQAIIAGLAPSDTKIQPIGNLDQAIRQSLPTIAPAAGIPQQPITTLTMTPPNVRRLPRPRTQQQQQQVGGGTPGFLVGQNKPQGAEWHRGKYVITREEKLRRAKDTYEADKMEKRLFRDKNKFMRKYGTNLSGMPGKQAEFDRRSGAIVALRRRAKGIDDAKHESPMLIFQKNLTQTNAQLQTFNQFLQSLQTNLQNLLQSKVGGGGGGGGGGGIGPMGGGAGGMGLPPPPSMGTAMGNGIDAGAQNLIAGLSTFGDVLTTGTSNLNSFATQFNDSTLKLGEHLVGFKEGIPELASAINNIGPRIEESLASAIPDAINLKTQQELNVNINGAEALSDLSTQLAAVANNAIRIELQKFAKNLNEHGPSMSTASIA